MRALRQHQLVGPSGLQVDELPVPSPGAGEIGIEVQAAAINFPDVLLSHGTYQFRPPLPFIPGGELAGIVSAVGPHVTAFSVGDRVAAWMLHGAFAEQVVVNESSAVKLPAEIPFEVGAATLVTYATTLHALVDRAALKKGETLLVLGAAGGVGLAAVELGKALGARVLAAASSEDKIAVCRQHGADEGIVYTREDLKARVKELSGGEGVDVIYDPVGGPYAEPALRSIAWQGRYLVVGFASGEIPKIPLNLTLLKGCQIVGVFWGSFALRDPAANRAHAQRLFHWITEGKLRPHIDRVLPLARAAEGLARLASREVKGKVVLQIASPSSPA
ncbi:MAG: NADPH:quinone oxidoreductase family protein [Myxococcales bacterium]|nr:NADPH:quinone oxidoreductase family protein [Myxococcales bacterium]